MPKLFCGDCLQVLASIPDACVDAVVTDPPYGLSFMGRKWDYDVPSKEIWEQCLRVLKPGGHLLAFAGTRTQHRMAVNIEDAGFEIRDMIAWLYGSGFPKSRNIGNGWGTALKPALEPITVARKPFKGTVATNVMEHGTGAINIGGCRVGDSNGRWPANLIHDGSDEVTELFPQTGNGNNKGVYSYAGKEYDNKNTSMFNGDKPQAPSNFNDSGSAARFFYCPKANKKDRGEGNSHPTVKPTDLMAYLCRLVTPPGSVVLDPFMGSGSTGKAAVREGFSFIGIERDEEYFQIAEKRLSCNQLSLT